MDTATHRKYCAFLGITCWESTSTAPSCLIIGEALPLKNNPTVPSKTRTLLSNMLKSIGLSLKDARIMHPTSALTIAPPYPQLLLVMGELSAQQLLQTDAPLPILRQTTHTYGDTALPVIVTHHPAYLLQHPLCKKEALRDLLSHIAGA
ncbi:MAG TPA: hypothetical protein VNC84_01015 [Gammaproteobacteria bacterium]|jgi:hypothetical protein|nr:hypothetical protein [Gammaproteobacteria bacterium]